MQFFFTGTAKKYNTHEALDNRIGLRMVLVDKGKYKDNESVIDHVASVNFNSTDIRKSRYQKMQNSE